MVFFVGSFWRQNVTINNEESALVSMRQRPLIVPATLHFSGLPQKSSIYTQEAITGKTINLTLFFRGGTFSFYFSQALLFQPHPCLCIVFILPGISVYFPAPTLYRFSNGSSITSLCTDPPPPPPTSPQEKSEKGLLLRFFLRGEGSVHRQEGDGLVTQAIHFKTLFSFIFSFVLTFIIARFGGTAVFSLIKFP